MMNGSVLWNLSSQEVGQLEKSWNVSIRIMFNLPRETHCYLIEEVSEQLHVKTILARRFLNFIQAVRSSKKKALRDLLKVVELDTQSVTGRNLINILIQTNIHDVRKLKVTTKLSTELFQAMKSTELSLSRNSLM